MENKLLKTMKVYAEYEMRFAEARLGKEFRPLLALENRSVIVDEVKRMLAYDEKLIPEIKDLTEIRRDSVGDCEITQLRYKTWDGFYSAATLFMPSGAKGPLPLTFVFCGHGNKGRLSNAYVTMAMRLARRGMAVMLPDNIGQGDRLHQGHWDLVAPFACGLTLQGLIAMESVALIRHMQKDPRIDKDRMAACGNSGGGTLCLLLAALAPELSVLAPSGYPSDFAYILSKERPHCACNLLLGCAHGPEMWEVLSCFAPKPLLIEQGANDDLIPDDLFLRTARKVAHLYSQAGHGENFAYEMTASAHPWTNGDRQIIADFIASRLGLPKMPPYDDASEELLKLSEEWHVPIPGDSTDTDALARRLSGKDVASDIPLEKVFPPRFEGLELSSEDVVEDIGRGRVLRILAQMECALWKN